MNTHIPRFGFGTWTHYDDACTRLVLDALEIGYRHIDTAEGYLNEAAVGKAIAESGLKRSDIFITTKVSPENFGPGQIVGHAKASLEKLRVDKVDLYLLHWPSSRHDIKDYAAQLGQVREMGLATQVGVSNFTKAQVDAVEAVLGKGNLATNQVEAHVLMQNRPIVDHCRAKGIQVTAYCPLARGRLSDHAGVKVTAAKHSATPEQIGLAFLLAEGFVAIPSSSKRERIQGNWDAQKITLSGDEISALRGMDENRRLVSGSWAPVWDT